MNDDNAPPKTAPAAATTAPSTFSSTSVVFARRLLVVSSPDASVVGRSIVLGPDALTIGRAPTGTPAFAVDDREISRTHVVVVPPTGDAPTKVNDHGSRNGTFVDGARVEGQGLHHGAVLRMGATLLVYEEVALRADERLQPETATLRGNSIAMQRVRAEVETAATRSMPVLVLGESGVGKELVARSIHERSGRRGAFVPLNCGAIPDELAESELFGHAAGAFTGAQRAREGLFTAAHGGTLFLDEIGEMPPSIQPALLRALAEGEVRAVGDARLREVNVRVVAATNRDLERDAALGTFRGDLLARLSGWIIRVPPLRERREDVLPLATFFLTRHGAPPLTADAAEALLLHPWPYNVRELRQVLDVAVARAQGATVDLPHLPDELSARIADRAPATLPAQLPIELTVRRDVAPSRDDLLAVLRHFDGNVAQVAAFFGKDRRQVYRWAERHGVDLTDSRPA